jgi:hypothetical protein
MACSHCRTSHRAPYQCKCLSPNHLSNEPNTLFNSQRNANAHFLALPAELRTNISAYVLGNKVVYASTSRVNNVDGTYMPPDLAFALASVCRRIYAKSSLMIYALNTFGFSWHCFTEPAWPDDVKLQFGLPIARGRIGAIRVVQVSGMHLPHTLYASGSGPTMRFFLNVRRLEIDSDLAGRVMMIAAMRRGVTVKELFERCEGPDMEVVLTL